MNPEEVLSRFLIIANIPLEEASSWIPLCAEASDEILRHLKNSVNPAEHMHRLTTSAAALAFYRYILYNVANGGAESFGAGELRIRTNTEVAIKNAYAVWLDAKRSIADLLNDEEFVFERINS